MAQAGRALAKRRAPAGQEVAEVRKAPVHGPGEDDLLILAMFWRWIGRRTGTRPIDPTPAGRTGGRPSEAKDCSLATLPAFGPGVAAGVAERRWPKRLTRLLLGVSGGAQSLNDLAALAPGRGMIGALLAHQAAADDVTTPEIAS